MKYKDVFDRSLPDGKKYTFMSIATTGLKDEDHIIALTFTDLDSDKVTSFYRSGADVLANQQYHGISETQYAEHALESEAFDKAVCDYLKDKIVVTYNLSFMMKFLSRDALQSWAMPVLPTLLDIAQIWQWISTNQVFQDMEEADLQHMMQTMSNWGSQRKAIKKVLAEIIPGWELSGACPQPFEMAFGLKASWQSLQDYPVSLLKSEEQDQSAGGVLHAPPIPSIPGKGQTA